MASPAPVSAKGVQPDDNNNTQEHHSGCTASSLAAAASCLQHTQFRYWVDEVLWSQGRVATTTIEEVLNGMGGQRTGGPHKPAPKGVLDASTEQVLQLRLSDSHQMATQQQQQQPSKQPCVLSGGQPAMAHNSPAVSRSSSEATLDSSRTSSANSLDSALLVSAANATSLAASPATATAAAATAAAAADASDAALSSEEPSSAAAAAGVVKRPDDQQLGYHYVQQWDLLWTKSVYAIRAARQLQQGQVVSAIAGLNCLSMKKRMVQTLRMALGTHAFQILPLSFCMPEDLPAWQAWLASPAGTAADTGLWMLKTGQDAGRGLKLVRTQQALQVALRPPKNPSKPQTHIKVAQQYITNPLLIRGRKFHLRLWLLVTGHRPLRAYLHNQGLVLFSSEPYEPKRPLDGPGVRPSIGHVTNYARNEDTWVWDLPQLQQHLGQQKWQRLWQQMRLASALTAAAVLAPLRAAHKWLQPSVRNYGFQMLGLDYLIDESYHPWLLEVNSAPSIMAVHSDPHTCDLIKATKQAMLADMLAMVQHRMPAAAGGCGGCDGCNSRPQQLSWQEELAAEMTNRGGWEPLMDLFPLHRSIHSGSGGSSVAGSGGAAGGGSGSGGGSRSYNIPWQEEDVRLQQLLQQQYSAGRC